MVDGFWESKLNGFGYELMGINKNTDALKVFELVVKLYPKSANAYDSLGECLLKLGKNHQEAALTAYKKALELNPNNKNAAAIVTSLKK